MGKFSCLESIQGCIEQLTNGHNTVDMKKIYYNLSSYYLSINQSILCSCNYVCNETKKRIFVPVPVFSVSLNLLTFVLTG